MFETNAKRTNALRWLLLLAVLVQLGLLANCGTEPPTGTDGATKSDGAITSDGGQEVTPQDTSQTQASCPDSYLTCQGECVNAQFNNNHCGACDRQCNGGTVCWKGQCECPPGQTDCNGVCVDVRSDYHHCGGCGNKCADGLLCADGRCVLQCPSHLPTNCYGGCVERQENERHCGVCGNTCAVDKGCTQGQCRCADGDTECSGRCVDTNANVENCGACGKTCPAGKVCSKGKCETTCGEGAENCGGGCVDVATSRYHCGGCNKPCRPGRVCQSGQCKCPDGKLLCGDQCIDAQTDILNCGGCNNKCSEKQTCASGKCVDISCPNKGEKACFGSCYDLQTSQVHCGVCGNACQPTQICEEGKCITGQQGACKAGELPCGSSCCIGAQICCNGVCKDGKEAETCNGKDDDCDGLIDEDMQAPPCSKQKGACAGARQICGGTKGWLPCDDTTYKAAHSGYQPTESKTDCDTIDNDCDGEVDEDCDKPGTCTDGQKRICYTGPKGTSGIAGCKGGTQTCNGGLWGPCAGEKIPVPESCDGLDNDCNGKVDNGLTQPCQSLCGRGTATCVAGKWECSVALPKAEVCDGFDNDCNGQIDDKLTRACTNLCGSGTETCINGKWSTCSTKPSQEICDGKDNDCDGLTDENCTCTPGAKRACGTARGECTQGFQECVVRNGQGEWSQACTGGVQPQNEVCDGKDNNCNGLVDENLLRQCYPSGIQGCTQAGTIYTCKGLCKAGVQACNNGTWAACTGHVAPATTELCDGKDNNCEGTIDENCPCTAGDKRKCGLGSGTCQQGEQTCDVNGKWGACVGGSGPAGESCDGKDNDCDGKVDEDLTRKCYTGKPFTADKGLCKSGTQTCTNGVYGACVGEATPLTGEVCNNQVDDDCNGLVDDACGWFQQIKGNDQHQYVHGMEGDGKGNAYVGGHFYRWAIFAGKTYNYTDTKQATDSAYVVKINDKGVYQWGFVPYGGRSYFGGIKRWGNNLVGIAGWGSRSSSSSYRVKTTIDFGNGKSISVPWGRHYAWLAHVDDTTGLPQAVYALGGSAGNRYGRDSVVDSKGNIYFGGDFSGNVAFGPVTLTATQSQHDLFIAKYDKSGNKVWIVKNEAKGRSSFCTPYIAHRSISLTRMLIDANDNIYLMGPFQGEAKFGYTTVKARDACAQNVFIAKVDSLGKFLWATTVRVDKDTFPKRMYWDNNGNIEITGTFAGNAAFDGYTLTSKGGHDFYVATLSTQGQFLKVRHIGSPADLRQTDMAYTATGDFVIGGRVKGNLDFGNPYFTYPSSGTEDAYVARFTAAGKLKWSLVFGGAGYHDMRGGISLSSNGVLFGAGRFDNKIYFNGSNIAISNKTDAFIFGFPLP